MATATPMDNALSGKVPDYRLVAGGYAGRRPFLVDSDDVLESLNAAGLPARGSAHPTLPNCAVRELAWERYGYRSSVVWAEYEPPSGGGFSFDNAEDGDTYAEWVFSQREATVTTAADGSAIPESSIILPSAELAISRFAADLDVITPWLPIFSPIPKINSNAFTVPGPWGLTGTISVLARQCLALPFEVRAVRDGLCRVTYRMGFGQPGWMDERYRAVDANGAATGPIIVKAKYEEANYPATLWGGA
jgi:hypothetical protein